MARYREHRAAGQDNLTALSNAMGSAGSACSGTVVAMAALVLTGLGSWPRSGSAPRWSCSSRWPPPSRSCRRCCRCSATASTPGGAGRRRPVGNARETAWWRLPTASGPYLVAASVVLLALAAPALTMKTGFPDAGDDSTGTTHRRAYDLLADGFGLASTPRCCWSPTYAAPAWTPPPSRRPSTSPPTPASPWSAARTSRGDTVVLPTVPTTAPADPETSATLGRVRDLVPANVAVSA